MRRVSVMGPGGITGSVPVFYARHSFLSVLPYLSSEISRRSKHWFGYLSSTYTRLNQYGFSNLLSQSRKITKKANQFQIGTEVIYWPPTTKKMPTSLTPESSEWRHHYQQWVPVRYQGKFIEADIDKVQYIDVILAKPRHFCFFNSFCPARRRNSALMGTHHLTQALPLWNQPLYRRHWHGNSVALAWVGLSNRFQRRSCFCRCWSRNSKIIKTTSPKLYFISPYDYGFVEINKIYTYNLRKYHNSSQDTCYNQHPLVNVDKVKKATYRQRSIFTTENCPWTKSLSLMLLSRVGLRRCRCYFRRCSRRSSSSIHIHEHAVTSWTQTWRRRTHSWYSQRFEIDLRNLGRWHYRHWFGGRTKRYLVGKIAPKGETELTAEERLFAPSLVKSHEVRDTSCDFPWWPRCGCLGKF